MCICMKCIYFRWDQGGYCQYHNKKTDDSEICEEYEEF